MASKKEPSQFDIENYVKPELLEEFKKDCERNSKDFYSCGVVATAHLIMMNLMQHKTERGIFKEDKLTPKQAHDKAFSQHKGHSGMSATLAVNMAITYSPRGEELRKWWNKKYDYKGDGMVNPCVFELNVK